MSTDSQPVYFNKSAYVALSCLIAFVVVITVCIIKQFIWDPLLAKRFEIIRPVLSESVRKFSTPFYRPQSTRTSEVSIHHSVSDACLNTTESPLLLPNQNSIPMPQDLPSQPIAKHLSPRSYGSSLANVHAYTNYTIEELENEHIDTPILHFSCEYNPSTLNVQLTIQNLRHMKIFHRAIQTDAFVSVRFCLSNSTQQTRPQAYQDLIRFDETFFILSRIHPGDILNHDIKFFIIILINEHSYEIAEGIYGLKNDCIPYILFVERTLPMNLKLVENKN